MPGQLTGRVLRSPHAHAVIEAIDVSRALALPGVKAVVTAADFPEQENRIVPAGEMQVNLRDVTRNVMAREKALYHGHAVAAVAATSDAVARAALKPHYEDLDWTGMEFPREQFDALQHFDRALWRQEVIGHEELFLDLHSRLPKEMIYERELLICRM
jgi:xanthine dehydrogenase molybdopterin-binding subunit B